MSGANSFGHRLVVTSFGESHGPALGAIIDGVPAGIKWDESLMVRDLERRRPGQSAVVTSRTELDKPEILSGVFEGKTLGTPIAIMVRSQDARSADYSEIAQNPRAGHADDQWLAKFGHSDARGGGRSSGRETVARVIAGAIGKMIIKEVAPEIQIQAFARQIGPFELNADDLSSFRGNADTFIARFPSLTRQADVEALLLNAKREGKSFGGQVEVWVHGAPKGLGQPVFHKLKSDLAQAVMSIGATCSFEVGAGLEATRAEGSEFHRRPNQSAYGGIRGGISTGERIEIKVGFKPTSSVLDVAKAGRHDPCIVPRAVPVVEAMVALVLADHLLWSRGDKI